MATQGRKSPLGSHGLISSPERRESAINGRSHHSRRVLHISLNQLKEIRQILLSQPINLEVQGVLA